VTLSAPTNAVLGTRTVHTHTILDNDPVNVGHAAMNLLATDTIFAQMAELDMKRKLSSPLKKAS
jgi:hypothetical protein